MKPKVRIAFAGLGVVGGGTLQLLREQRADVESRVGAPVEVKWILSRSKKPGRMDDDSSSGKISFRDGPLGKGFEAHAGRRADGAAVIILVDTDLAPKADAYDYCTRKKS